MGWLTQHDPVISWSQRSLTFGSAYCMENCLQQLHPQSQVAAAVLQAGEVTLPQQYAEFQQVFSKREADKLPPHRPYDCQIELVPGAQLPPGKLYTMSEQELANLKDFIEKNLARGFIRESKAVGGSPVFWVDKKNTQEKRLICDFRILNSLTLPTFYPMPRIDDLLAAVRKGRIFTKLDLRGAYNLIRIREGDEWKTTMYTPLGAYEYLVMPFGLQAGSQCFQAFMHHVLGPVLFKHAVVYLDDVLVYSEDPEEHVTHVKDVLRRLQENQLCVKLEKCQFHATEVDFLGYRLSDKGIAMDTDKVEAIMQWKSPKTKKDVQRFVGFANFYRKFLPAFADMTAPITDCLKGKKKFRWTEEAQRAFETLKGAFASEGQLLHVNSAKPIRIETDASDRAIAAVLLQQDPAQEWRPCAFYSRKLSKSEANYAIWDKELLAVVAAFKHWRHFLVGAQHQIQVYTDHKNLEYWRTARILNQRQMRWAEFFANFNFHIQYVPGDQNVRADALSRKPEYLEEQGPPVARAIFQPEQWRCGATLGGREELVRLTQADDFARRKLKELREGDPKAKGFEEKEGLLLFKGALYVPGEEMRARVLRQLHDNPTAGHFGQFKTTVLVTREFWWPRVRQEVKDYVRGCEVCQRAKGEREKPAGLLEPLPTPCKPWEAVSLDFITDLPPSKGKTAVLVVVDLLTKMAHFIACPKVVSAEETAKLFVQHVFKHHGMPERVISDRGVQFTSRFWRKLMQILQVQVNLSSARHPQSNGQSERVNSILQQYLRCYASQQHSDWSDRLSLAEFAYNNAQQVSAGMSPFQAVYGSHPRAFPTGGGEGTAGDVPAAEQFAEELQALHQLLRDNLERAKSAYKRAADQHRREGESIKVGDKVWLSTQGLPMPGRGKKLRQCRIGPFEVVEQINPVAFRLQLPETMRIHPVFHRSLLSKFREPHRYQQGNQRGSQELPLVDMEHFNEATAILDSRWRGDELQYLVAWEGEPESENTWIPAEDVTKEYLVWEFHELYPDKPKPYRWQMREVLQPTDSEEGDFWGFPSSDADSGGGGNELQGSPHSPTEGVEVEGDIAAAEDWWSRCLPPPWSRKDWEEVFQSSSSSSSADTTIFLGFPSSPGTAGESEGGEWDPAGDLGYPDASPAKPPQGGKGGLGGGMDVRDWPEPGGVAEGTEASGGHPWTPEEVLRAWEQEEAAPRLSPETGKEVWRSGGEEVSPPVLTEEERVAWEPMGGEENMETEGEQGVENVARASVTTSREDESERDEGNAGASRVKKRKRRSERRRWGFKRLLCWGEKRKPLLGESDSSEEDEV